MNNILKLSIFTIFIFTFGFSANSQVAERDQDITIKNIDHINSDALDFAPTFYREGIVFVTSRNTERKVDKKIGEPFFDLYYSDLGGNEVPAPPQPFSVKINSEYHEGPVTFNKAGDKIFFTQNNLDLKNEPIKSTSGEVKMKIYEADKGDTEWVNIRALPFNSDEYSCMHPSIDVDNKRLYFSSDMPGGYGGMDIYYSDFKNGTWTKPMNMGTKVNSQFDEVFPFIHNSGVLYFSSDVAGGQGGFDLYRLMPDRAVPFALPMGTPFNSSGDDIGLIVTDKGKSGFFTSSRNGKDDIFSVNAPNGIAGIPVPIEYLSTNFHTYDAVTKEPISNAGIMLFSADDKESLSAFYDVDVTKFNNNEIGLKITLTNKGMNALPNLYTDKKGDAYAKIAANRQYFILAKKEGYEPREVIYKTFTKAGENGIGIAMNPIPKVTKVEKPIILEEGATIVADKIFYDFDKSYIRVGAARDLDAVVILMKKYPEIEIDLIAHTDSRGTKMYNQKLSENRAISAKNYLIANGIEGYRIATYGKGETSPRNGCSDGVKCSETEYQYNRRTEIYIRKMNPQTTIKYQENEPDRIDAMRE